MLTGYAHICAIIYNPRIYAPSFSTASSSSLQTPKTPALQDPYASPKSLNSVKRKPVPRHLYSEGMMEIESSPLRPVPPSPLPLRTRGEYPNGDNNNNLKHAQRDVTNPPIGPKFPNLERKSGTSGHARSVSEFGVVGAPLLAWSNERYDHFVDESPALAPCARILYVFSLFGFNFGITAYSSCLQHSCSQSPASPPFQLHGH